MRRAAVVVCCSCLLGGLASGGATLLPWEEPRAQRRQVVEVTTDRPRSRPVISFECEAPASARLRVVDASEPTVALPVFRSGSVAQVCLSRTLSDTAHVVAYWSDAGGLKPSRTLATPPVSGDDYASATYGDAWDFNEGDQEGIQHWGDGPQQYGKITVADGLLTIPVKGGDPYLIWGAMFNTASRSEHIDSGLYTRLRMRVRQSCGLADWSIYVTDAKGSYTGHTFKVRGNGFQTLEFDMPGVFSRSWDGRMMRALRIDTTNNKPGTTVQIDWVRLERKPLHVTTGPTLTAAAVRARARVGRFEVVAPARVTAGERARFGVRGVRGSGVPLMCELRDASGRRVAGAVGASGPTTTVAVDAPTRAATLGWTVGVSDDLGRPGLHEVSGFLDVVPGELHHYEVTPASRFVAVGSRKVRVTARGADAFGNEVVLSGAPPRVSVSEGSAHGQSLSKGVLRFEVDCSDVPLVTHLVSVTDARGVTGRCDITTVRYRASRISISPGGYLMIDETQFLPLGGFYANWPSVREKRSGRVRRALDLFPCNAKRYPHGFPWSADTERAVVEFLDLCRDNGVTCLRLMLRNMDLVGRVDRTQLDATLHLFDLAYARGMRFNVALFEDYDKPPYCNREIIERVVLPHYDQRSLSTLPPHRARFLVRKEILDSPGRRYVDADAIRCQKEYLDELIPVLAGREEVLCYEFENEMVYPPMSWCRTIADHIKSIDPYTPVLGNPGPHLWPVPLTWRDAGIHLYSYHPYAYGRPGVDQGAEVFLRAKWGAAVGVPFFPGEGGVNQSMGVPNIRDAFAMRCARDLIWHSLTSGATGAFLWTPEFESEMREFGTATRALTELGVELATFERRTPRAVVSMPKDATANTSALRLSTELLARGVDFDVRPIDECGRYAVRIDGASPRLPGGVRAEFFEPAKGWHLSSLVSTDGRALLYLRNVSGSLNTDAKRGKGGRTNPAYLRTPAPARPSIRIRGGTWRAARAFDLDERRAVPARISRGTVALGGESAHDFVIALRGR